MQPKNLNPSSTFFKASKVAILKTKSVIFMSTSSPVDFYIVFLVEEHTKAVIFFFKTLWVQVPFLGDFSQYKCLNFVILFSNSTQYNHFYMQRRWKNTLKLWFLSANKLQFLCPTCLFSLVFICKKLWILSAKKFWVYICTNG